MVRSESERDSRPGEPSIGDIVDGAVRRIMTGIVIAAGAIALAIYARPSPPRYEAIATETGVVRLDTRSGTMIACEAGRCTTILRRGQRLERRPRPPVLPSPAPAPAQKALPSPSEEKAPASR